MPGVLVENGRVRAGRRGQGGGALQSAKITLVQAIATAEKTAEGRALNAGLEQVRGRAVWEILIQNTVESKVHIPDSGIILGELTEQRQLSKVETNH